MNRRRLFVAVSLLASLPLAGCGTSSMFKSALSVDETMMPQYQQIDSDGNKSVSHADTRAWLDRVLAENDKDRNGKLSPAEVPAMLVAPKPDAQSFVRSYDRDSDGTLSLDELGVYVNVLFQRDADADGQLTYEEARHVPKRQSDSPESSKAPVGGANSAGGSFPNPSR